MTSGGRQERDDAGRLLVLASAAVDRVPWGLLRGLAGVHQKVLWRSGDVVIGLIRVDPGASEPGHVHYSAHHHIWIVAGEGTMMGQRVGAGSYLYVPPGVQHDVTDVGPEGCTF